MTADEREQHLTTLADYAEQLGLSDTAHRIRNDAATARLVAASVKTFGADTLGRDIYCPTCGHGDFDRHDPYCDLRADTLLLDEPPEELAGSTT